MKYFSDRPGCVDLGRIVGEFGTLDWEMQSCSGLRDCSEGAWKVRALGDAQTCTVKVWLVKFQKEAKAIREIYDCPCPVFELRMCAF